MSLVVLMLVAWAILGVELVLARVAPRSLLRIAWVSLGPPKALAVHPTQVDLAVPQPRAGSYRTSAAERATLADVVAFPVEILGEHGRLVPIDGGRSAMLVPTGTLLGSAVRIDVEPGREPRELAVHARFSPLPLLFAVLTQIAFILLYVKIAAGDDPTFGLTVLVMLPLFLLCGRAFVMTRRGVTWAVELAADRLGARHPEAASAEDEALPADAERPERRRRRARVRIVGTGDEITGEHGLVDEEAEAEHAAPKRRRTRRTKNGDEVEEPG